MDKFMVHERGLNRFFGPLEARIMGVLWNAREMSIKDVQLHIEREKNTNFNTVMTVMNRLVVKGLLTKRTEGRVSLYRPTVSREHFLDEQSKELTQELLDEFGSLVVSHMLDALEEVDQQLIEKLEHKIQELKKG